MNPIADHYEVYYADKLWNLLPAVYRTEDTDQFQRQWTAARTGQPDRRAGRHPAPRSSTGCGKTSRSRPATTGSSPIIGDLVATNLVSSLDARGQRLDVAKTIYYRRRKGTVAILEEIAHDITGWDANASSSSSGASGAPATGWIRRSAVPLNAGDDLSLNCSGPKGCAAR